eukprot:6055916-Pleurochrysis_carterae.AAC.1
MFSKGAWSVRVCAFRKQGEWLDTAREEPAWNPRESIGSRVGQQEKMQSQEKRQRRGNTKWSVTATSTHGLRVLASA